LNRGRGKNRRGRSSRKRWYTRSAGAER
jgi:hypothetical protein